MSNSTVVHIDSIFVNVWLVLSTKKRRGVVGIESRFDYWKCTGDHDIYEAAIILLTNMHKEKETDPVVLCKATMDEFDNEHADFPFYPEMQRDLKRIARGLVQIQGPIEGKGPLLPRVDISFWGDRLVIKKFENNIIFNPQSLTVKVERSKAGKELRRRGAKILKPIVDHLKENMPSRELDIAFAWGWLINKIEIDIDPKRSGPQKLNNTEGWIEWAEKFSI